MSAGGLYRPLDRTINEVRLLRILLSTQALDRQNGLEAASDVVQCELEYQSMDDMATIDEKPATSQFMDMVMLKMLGLELNGSETPEEAQHIEKKRQAWKTMVAAAELQDETKVYPISPERLLKLEEQHKQSREKLVGWLPYYFEKLAADLPFEQWLQNWLWRPLSGDKKFALKPTRGYFALSYVWADLPLPLHNTNLRTVLKLAEAGGLSVRDLFSGNAVPKTKPILLNGQQVEVGENLEKALRALREIPEIRLGQRVWVDSLCIDQANLSEKGEEVKRMSNIYGKANRVISYIGDDENNSGEVLEVMEALGEALKTEEAASLLNHWCCSDADCAFFYYFTQLMSRPYWSRIWIMQEIAMGNTEDSIIICGMKRFSTKWVLGFGKRHVQGSAGDNSIPRRDFPIGRDRTANQNDPILTMGALVDGIAKLKNIFEFWYLLETYKVRVELFNTLWFRTAAENFATDPRDTVYGMLALLPDWIASRIQVDYSADNSYEQVMMSFAMAHIQAYNSLHWILLRPGLPSYKDKRWPSWVPNLGLPFSTAHLWWTVSDFGACNGLQDDGSGLLAENDGSLLHCRGFRVDTVRQVTTPVWLDMTPTENLWTTLPEFLAKLKEDPTTDSSLLRDFLAPMHIEVSQEDTEFVDEAGNCPRSHKYGDREGLRGALDLCIKQLQLVPEKDGDNILDIPYDTVKNFDANISILRLLKSPSTSATGYSGMNALRSLLENAQHLDLWGTNLHELFASEPREDRDVPTLRREDRGAAIGRLFTTSSGYVGSALGDVHAGDELYIIDGCWMPVALRASPVSNGVESAYGLLGGVFIPGVMKGEAVRTHLANEGKISKVTLC